MWREKFLKLEPECEFLAPTTLEQIVETEQALGVEFPQELKSLLLESNGVWGAYELGLIWAIERIKAVNIEMRSQPVYAEIYMPFDSLLFFADAGNGDQFGYVIVQGKIKPWTIFAWNH